MTCSMYPSSRLLWDRGLLVCLVGSFDRLLMNRESLKWRIFSIIAPTDMVLLVDWNILSSGRVILCLRRVGSLPRTSPTVLTCCLLIGSAEDCAEPKGGVVLALCMTSLITLLCMHCAVHLRVACGLNFIYAEFLYYWVQLYLLQCDVVYVCTHCSVVQG